MLRLNDLKNFLEASAVTTFSEAARKLGITQPALSESIKRLEKDLGEILFFRSKSGITLTPCGRKTIDRAKQIFGLLGEMDPHIQDANATFPTVSIGCHPVIGSYFLPEALQRLAKLIPQYRVDIKHGLSRNVQADLQRGIIDIGIVVNPVSNPDLIIKKFATDVVCVWKSKHKDIQDQIICDMDLFQTQSILRKWKRRPQTIVSTTNLELLSRLTEAGIGYGIIPTRLVTLMGNRLVKISGTPEQHDEFCLVYRPEFGKNTYEKQIIKSLSEI